MNHIEQFRDAIRASGLTPPDQIFDDGKRHRFSSNGNRNDDSGWYILYGDERPAGAFGCWRSGINSRWKSSDRREFSAEERAAWKQRMAEVEQQRAEEERQARERAATKAAEIWRNAQVDGTHPYLDRKNVPALGVRIYAGRVAVPMRHGPGALVGLQLIDEAGGKKFLSGTPLDGAYHVLGKPTPAGPVVIVEGWATGASVHLATGWCVVVAFNAGNLPRVARKIRQALPDADIIIGADDDAWTARKDGTPWNPGVEAAEAAAREIGARVAVPAWPGDRPHKHTDFNDLHVDEGLDAVRECFVSPYHPPSGDGTDKPASVVGGPDQSGSARDVPEWGFSRDDAPMIFSGTPLETARLFQQHLPEDGKIIFWRGEFYTWDRCRYVVREKVYLHKLLYDFMSRCVTLKTDPKTGDSEVVGFNPRRSHIEDVMHALAAVCSKEFHEAPCWIDRRPGDPEPGEIMVFQNGFLHIPTRTLMSATHRLFVVNALDFDYTPDAPAPTEWLRFLEGVWGDDPESIAALGEMFGYLLTDDTSQQKMFLMVGPPRSGKGTILRVLESLVGHDNRVSPSLQSLGGNFGLQPLIGKRLAMISDARLSGRADQAPIVENLLRITGEDTLSVDRKFLGPWSGKLSVRFVMASNEVPSFTDASSALPNRFIMFKMTRSYLGHEDHGLTARLMRELPGILLWALDGLDRLRERGYLMAPSSGQELHDEMREQASPVSAFVGARCVLDPSASVPRDDLYKAWLEWCEEEGMDYPGTKVAFGRRLSAAFPQVGRTQPRGSSGRTNLYTGIRLRSEWETDASMQQEDDEDRPF